MQQEKRGIGTARSVTSSRTQPPAHDHHDEVARKSTLTKSSGKGSHPHTRCLLWLAERATNVATLVTTLRCARPPKDCATTANSQATSRINVPCRARLRVSSNAVVFINRVLTEHLAKQCYHCQGLGHVQADCPTLRITGASAGGRCYSCGQAGHLARNCPTPNTGAPSAPAPAPRGGRGGFRGGHYGVQSTLR